MTYGDTLFGAYYNAHRLPDWLPTDGLVYYDDFAELRPFALTGQAYSEAANANVAYAISTLGGRKCLYKAEGRNQLNIDLKLAANNYTWGCFVYDELGTCTNQQTFNLNTGNDTDLLTFRDSSDRIGIGRYSGGATSSRVRVSGKYTRGQWHLLLAWQGNQYWGIGFDATQNAGNTMNSPRYNDYAHFLPAFVFGIGIRNAFAYRRVLSQTEVEQIYANGI